MGLSDSSSQWFMAGDRLWQWWQQAQQQAIAAQIPRAELEWLLGAVAGLDPLALRLATFRHRPQIAASHTLDQLDALWQQRLHQRVPVQYLVGETTWRHFRVRVSPAVLVPRPETELMIDIALAVVAQSSIAERLRQGTWVDLGTGSGAIAIGLATAFPQASIIATDVSEAALDIAQHNAQLNHVHDRIEFRQGSWFEPLTDLATPLAGIVSNPPYIPSAIIPTLAPEVADHEPHLALDGGLDGLGALQIIAREAPPYLIPEGVWLVEMMLDQATQVTAMLRDATHYQQIQVHADLTGRDRFVSALAR